MSSRCQTNTCTFWLGREVLVCYIIFCNDARLSYFKHTSKLQGFILSLYPVTPVLINESKCVWCLNRTFVSLTVVHLSNILGGKWTGSSVPIMIFHCVRVSKRGSVSSIKYIDGIQDPTGGVRSSPDTGLGDNLADEPHLDQEILDQPLCILCIINTGIMSMLIFITNDKNLRELSQPSAKLGKVISHG